MLSDKDTVLSAWALEGHGLISADGTLIIISVSRGIFRNYLIIQILKANVNSSDAKESFRMFLLQNEHYAVLYKQWKKVGKEF